MSKKQQFIVTRYKLYKSGKLWLVGSITALALTAGLSVYQPLIGHADSTVTTSTSGDMTTSTVKAVVASQATESTTNTNLARDSANNAVSSVNKSQPAASSDSKGIKVSNQSNTSQTDLETSSAATKPTDVSTSQSASNQSSSAIASTSTIVSQASSAASSVTSAATVTSQVSSTAVTATGKKDNGSATTSKSATIVTATSQKNLRSLAVASTVTPPTLSSVPRPSNFFVSPNGKYILYNAKAALELYPYNGNAANTQLYGFYVILPNSITGTLADFQAGADAFVKGLPATGIYANFNSLNVYQFNNTTDGRQVFYFRPNDGAQRVSEPSLGSWSTLNLTVSTGADTNNTPASIQFNANNDSEIAGKDVIFAGAGSYSSGWPWYPAISSASLGTNTPDQYLMGISYNGINRTVTYTHVQVKDSYQIIDRTTGKVIKTITSTGQDGATYQRKGLIDSLSALGLATNKYYQPSLTVNSGLLTDTMAYQPSKLFVSDSDVSNGVAGNTYQVYVGELKTSLIAHDTTVPIIAGPKAQWQLSDNLTTAIGPDGSPLTMNQLTTNLTPDVQTPGTYNVIYRYHDDQGNVTTATAKVIVVSSKAKINAHDSHLKVGTTWNPADNFTSFTTADGQVLTDFSQITVVGSVNTNQANQYPITYRYTDSVGNVSEQTITVSVFKPIMVHYLDENGHELQAPTELITSVSNPDVGQEYTGRANTVAIAGYQFMASADTTKGMALSGTLSLADLLQGNAIYLQYHSVAYHTSINYPDQPVQTITQIFVPAKVVVIGGQYGIDVTQSYFATDSGTKLTLAETLNKMGLTTSQTQVFSATDFAIVQQAVDALTQLATSDDPMFKYDGPYQLNYQLITNQASVQAHGLTLIAGPTQTWKASDSFDGAIDSFGNDVPLSSTALIINGTVNPQVVGQYPITYMYTDAAGRTVKATIVIKVVATQSTVNGHDSTLIQGPHTNWSAKDNFDGGMTATGQALNFAAVTTIGTVDLSTPGVYPVTYQYTDMAGNVVTKEVMITVKQTDSAIKGHDSTLIMGPKTKWQASDNFDGATNENGKPLDFSAVKVSGTVDLSKTGQNIVQYQYTDTLGNVITKDVTIIVKRTGSTINGHDSTLIMGPKTKWQASDNFDGVTDENGNSLDFSNVKVSGDVDLRKAGQNIIRYQYTDAAGNLITKDATVLVKQTASAIKGHDSTLIMGPKTKWQASDNFDSVTDENGSPLDFSNVKVLGDVDLIKLGQYTVTYQYIDTLGNLIVKSVQVKVVSSKSVLIVHDSTVSQNNQLTWNPADNFTNCNDAIGKPIKLKNVTVIGQVDLARIGTYKVSYLYVDQTGNQFDQVAVIHVIARTHDQPTSNHSSHPTTTTHSRGMLVMGQHGVKISKSPVTTHKTGTHYQKNAAKAQNLSWQLKQTSPNGKKQVTSMKTKTGGLPQTNDANDVAISLLGLVLLGLSAIAGYLVRRSRLH
ncbi:bacterial Ig-like domain-containing protein [Lactiplantibacillus plantarum]|uniref:bacterial Ig-like domain-containing protein n=1 Tax=Lactiplantibacillus plantarum TaxID=1590 RepID=UPI000978CCDC|nr:bacterial Ig-like domain-containing protein [Lactiplantibacillus plantarum]